jgi:branched-chain amino acid transport system ATP-binding protein
MPAHRRAAAGIAFVPDGRRVFRERTVAENVALGTHPLSLSRRDRAAWCAELLAQFPALAVRRTELAGSLSGGQQQLLALCQALAARPRLLLLDEPSAGLAPAVAADVLAQIRRVADGGVGVLLVEQRVADALTVADHATILENGATTASPTAEPAR